MNPALTQQLQAAHDYDLHHRNVHRAARPPRRSFSLKPALRVHPPLAQSPRTV